ncbi:MAG: hypothetical protein SGCHY_003974 [Lobulomycetales sp.]
MREKQRFSWSLPRPAGATKQTWHYCGINCIVQDPTSGALWTGGRDGQLLKTIVARDSLKLAPSSSIGHTAHSHWINSIVCKNGAVYSASSDRSVIALHKDYHVALYYHNDYVKCLANPTATSNIISAGLDRNIIVWDTRKESSHVSPIHTSKTGIYSLATDVSGSTVVYGGPDGLLRILDTRQPQTSPKAGVALIGHKDTVKSILLHDTTLVTAGADSICKIWDIRARACESTLGFDSQIWTLNAPDPENLDVFWIGCRDGSVIKTARKSARIPDSALQPEFLSTRLSVSQSSFSSHLSSSSSRPRPSSSVNLPVNLHDVGERFEQVEGVDCVLVAKESSPVTGICVVQSSTGAHSRVCVTTTSPDMHVWPDVCLQKSRVVRARARALSPAAPEIPRASLIPQNTAPPFMAGDPVLADRGVVAEPAADLDTTATAAVATAARLQDVEAVPLFVEPIEARVGGPCFVTYAILNDRRRVVALDSFGDVSIWDIIRCKRVAMIRGAGRCVNAPTVAGDAAIDPEIDGEKAFGPGLSPEELFGKVVDEYNSLIWVANWCTVDLRIGSIMIHMDESQFLSSESYFEDCGLTPLSDNPDLRINLGRWTLSMLLLHYTYKVHAIRRDLAVDEIRQPLIASLVSPSDISPAAPLPLPAQPVDVESGNGGGSSQAHIDYTGRRASIENGETKNEKEANAAAESGGPEASDLLNPNTNTSALESSPERSVTPNSTGSGFMGKLKGHMRIRSGNDRKWTFGGGGRKKHGDSESEDDEEDPTAGWPESRKSLHHMGNSLENLDKSVVSKEQSNALQEVVPHFSVEDTPYIQLPQNVRISISSEEVSPNVSGYIDKFTSKLSSITNEKQMLRLKSHLPFWIQDCIVEGSPVNREPIKISFLLLPMEGSKLKELPNGANRLSANRMIRIRKLLGYVLQRVSVEDTSESSKVSANETAQEKAERLLELVFEGKVVGLKTTLATLKFQVGKSGGDLELRYRRR